MAERPDSGREKRVCVARIGAAHGLKGEVRLWSFTQVPDAVAGYGALETADGKRKLRIKSLRPGKDHFVARFEGVDDRDAAEALRNVDLYIARDRLPETEDDETYYHADLIGLEAVTRTGESAGEIAAVHNFGAGDILEIRKGGESMMVPFTDASVPEIDIAGGRVVIDPPAVAPDDAERS